MNTISFSTEDFPSVKDCKVGQPETLTVTITPTAINGDEVTADVTDVAYGEAPEEEAQDQESSTGSPASKIGMPMMGKKAYA